MTQKSIVLKKIIQIFLKAFQVLRKKRERREFFYTFFDSKVLLNKKKSVLFVDGGANLGQGFMWFSSFYSSPNVSFHLFEPNPNCQRFLRNIVDQSNRKIKLFDCGIAAFDGIVKFYGLSDNEGGMLSQGGSINFDHNSNWYQSSIDTAIDVRVIDFENYLIEQSKVYEKIIVKMDIEGAEVDLLEKLIEKDSIKLISVLYVEFHSQFQIESKRMQIKKREENIVQSIRKSGVKIRIWH